MELGEKTSALGGEGELLFTSETLAWAEKRMFICVYTQKTHAACGQSGGLESLLEGGGDNGALSRERLIRKRMREN